MNKIMLKIKGAFPIMQVLFVRLKHLTLGQMLRGRIGLFKPFSRCDASFCCSDNRLNISLTCAFIFPKLYFIEFTGEFFALLIAVLNILSF